jgi:hypothetical protein
MVYGGLMHIRKISIFVVGNEFFWDNGEMLRIFGITVSVSYLILRP